jgi:hypothetical protein
LGWGGGSNFCEKKEERETNREEGEDGCFHWSVGP